MARKKIGTEREDGLIQGKVYLGNGKYKYVYAHSQKELDTKIQDLKVKLGKGLDISAQRDSLKKWAERWLKIKKAEVSEHRHYIYL